jgi:PAS domain S-box-containing protein
MTTETHLAVQFQNLALIGLQMQVERGDLNATLARLVQGLADLCQAQVVLCRGVPPADTVLALAVSHGAALPAPDSGEARLLAQALRSQGALSYGSWLAMPVQRYGLTHGALALQTNGSLDLSDLAGQIDPVVSALASLLVSAAPARDDEAAPPVPGLTATLLRTALRESGTYIWEWDVPTDALSDIDEGAAMLGYARHELGRTQRDWNRLIHPDDLAPLEQSYEAHLRGECAVFEHVYRARARDGSWRWVQERGRIVEWCADGSPRRMIGTQADVSPQMSQQARQRELTERLHRIARQLPGVLLQFHQVPGRRGQFEFVSERARELLGLDPDAVMADALQVFGRVDQDDLAALLVQASRCIAQGTPLLAEARLAHAGSGLIRLRCHAQCQTLGGGEAFWHAYVEDVTELATGSTAPGQAAEAARHHGDFLARMSHELRSPLSVMLGFAQLLLHDTVEPLTPSQWARLSRIHDAADHLQAMLGDLLDLAHLDAVRLTLLAEPVALDELLRHCADLMRPMAERCGLQLLLAQLPPLVVKSDRLRVQQILLSVIGNAIKYNRPQGWVQLDCNSSTDGLYARVEVSDSGPGLSAEQLAHLFEPFNRLGREHSGVDGLGVGLALSRSLALAMGGRLVVQSLPGQGVRVSLDLPQVVPGPDSAGGDGA